MYADRHRHTVSTKGNLPSKHMLLLGFVALGVAVRQLDDNGVAVASDQQEQQAAPLVPGTEPAPLVVPGAEPLANAGDTCVSISPGTTDNWCQLTCTAQACPESLCKCGADAEALNASKTEAAATPALSVPVDNQKWNGALTTNASCISIQSGTTDNWCQMSCGTVGGCPDTLCKCGVKAASKKQKEEAELMASACDFDAEGCIDKNGVEDCRTCALHFADCVASPHTDDDGMPKILSVDECIDEVASAAKGCSKCKSKESKAAWRIRVGDPSP